MIVTKFTIFSMYLRAMLDNNNYYCTVIFDKVISE